MDCERACVLVSAEIDRELDAAERTALDAHLAECADCRDIAATFRQQDAELRRAFAPRRQAAAAVADRVVAELRLTAPPVPLRVPWMAMIVSAAAGFLLAALLFRPWQQSQPVVVQQDAPTKQPTDRGVTPNPVPEQPLQRPMAQLAYASGAIEMLRAGDHDWTRMQTGEAISAGTRVRTGPIGRCEFRTLEGSLVRLNHQTELVFHTNRKLELADGQIWSRVEEGEVPFEVRVPHQQATVTALGTQFDILSHAAETLLTVIQGSTRVNGNGWQEVVRKGQKAKIVQGALAETSPARNLVVATSWVNEILKMKGPDNPELAERMNDLLAQIGEGKVTYLAEKEILQLGDHCVLPLTRFIQSERSRNAPFKRIDAARILAKIAQPWSVPDLIELLADRQGELRYHAAKALDRLTDGMTHGLTPEEWRDSPAQLREPALRRWQTWWDKNKDRYPAPPYSTAPANPDQQPEPEPSAVKPKSNS